MSIVASLLSIALFLAFVSAGAQKIMFNPITSRSADRLGLTKGSYRRVGLLEVLGGVGLLVGLAATRTSLLGIINEVSAGCLAVLMVLAVLVHLRSGDKAKYFSPALALAVAALIELAARLV